MSPRTSSSTRCRFLRCSSASGVHQVSAVSCFNRYCFVHYHDLLRIFKPKPNPEGLKGSYMSKGYGWQCESAIIPKSQSRTINNVDSRSLLALKALATSSATNSNKRKAISEFDLPAKSRAFNNNNNQHIKKNADKDSVSGKSKIKSKEGNVSIMLLLS